MSQRLPKRASAFDRHERREIVHIRPLIFGIEPIVRRRHRDRLLGDILTEGLFHEAGVDVRCMIWRDNKIYVLRYVPLTFDLSVEYTVVQRVRCKIDD